MILGKNSKVEYNLDYVNTYDLGVQSKWYKHKADIYYQYAKFKPGFEFSAEDKKVMTKSTDSLYSTSLKYYQYDPYLEIENIYGIKLKLKYSFREDIYPIDGLFVTESNSTAQDMN